ncbi:UNVERIFIED_CONTAM: hypothetical protein GTU68_038479 [Idotea baltica]|nr:hypothetical protein [Idotea baltica]
MPSITAARRCPDLIFVKPRFNRYRDISHHIRDIFNQYTDLVEPLSLDEAYLDVTTNKKGMSSATQIAREIRAQIWKEVELTASAGISINKFLAKVASDINKPDGITLIPPDRAETFIEKLPIEKFFGIGKVTAKKMKRMGIRTGLDLKSYTELELAQRFGKMGRHFFRIVRGLDERVVQPNRLRKSVGAENTFSYDLTREDEMLERLQPLTDKVAERLTRMRTAGKTITLKIKFEDFTQTTRSKTLPKYVHLSGEITPIIQALLNQPIFPEKPVRLLGVYMSNLDNETDGLPRQLTLDF